MSLLNYLMTIINNTSMSGGGVKFNKGTSILITFFVLLTYLLLKAFIVYIGSNALIQNKTIYIFDNQRKIKYAEALLIVIVAQSLFTS